MKLVPAIQRLRKQRGLGQQELARMAGLSRQSLYQIESGASVPSTLIALQLAKALGCRVEELFGLDEAGPLRATVAQPLSEGPRTAGRRVVAALVGGRWVAHRLDPRQRPQDLSIPCDAELVRGRLLPLVDERRLAENVLLAGCDPALGLLAAHTDRNVPGARNIWLQATSGRALAALGRSEVHLAGAHLFDEESREYNVPFVRRSFPERPMIVVTVAQIEEGLAVPKGNPRKLRGVRDLARRNIRFINRDQSAGARRLLERLLRAEGVEAARISGYERIAPGHVEAAMAVASGTADAAMVTCGAALSMGLDFVPLADERFDLVLPKEWLPDPRISRLLDTLGSAGFRRELASIGGYSAGRSGSIAAELP